MADGITVLSNKLRLGGVVASRSLPAQRVGVQSPPDTSRPVTRLRIGTASDGDTHSLALRTNPLQLV